MSSAIDFVTLAWRSAVSGVDHSWNLYNSQVLLAAEIAARGFRWEPGDLDKFCALTNYSSSILRCVKLENLYTIAVESNNMTYCTEYERYVGREPIIVDGANGRKLARIHVGSEFQWDGERVTVTSFRDDGSAIAVAYNYHEARRCTTCYGSLGGGRLTVKKRYVITRAAVIAERKRQRKQQSQQSMQQP